jgi:hypothetical protein
VTKSFAQAIPASDTPQKRRRANLGLARHPSLHYPGKLASVHLFPYIHWFSHLSTREKKLAGGVPAIGSSGCPPPFDGFPVHHTTTLRGLSAGKMGSHICRPVKNNW